LAGGALCPRGWGGPRVSFWRKQYAKKRYNSKIQKISQRCVYIINFKSGLGNKSALRLQKKKKKRIQRKELQLPVLIVSSMI